MQSVPDVQNNAVGERRRERMVMPHRVKGCEGIICTNRKKSSAVVGFRP